MWRDRYEGLIGTLIQGAINAGEIRPVDVPLAGRLVLSALNWMHRWYKPKRPGRVGDRRSLFRHDFQRAKSRVTPIPALRG